MDTDLVGKIGLITGGSTGVGLGIATALAKEGVHLAIASRNPEQHGLESLSALGTKVLPLSVDVSKEDQVVRMVQETIEGLGGLDLYINNAAAHWDELATQLTSEGWMNSLNTNLSACVWACREVSRHFIRQGHGSILIVGSTAQFHPAHKETGYRVSKTGLRVYMEVLSIELAPFNIRVNMLTPGSFPSKLRSEFLKVRGITDKDPAATRHIPFRRVGKLEEIGPTAALLLSDKLSGFTTGADFVVDGGSHLRPLPLMSDEEIRRQSV